MVLAVPGPNKVRRDCSEALCGGASSLYHCPPRRRAHCAAIGRRAVHQGGGSRDSRGQGKPRAEDDPKDHANRGPSSQRRRRKGSADSEAFGQRPGGGHRGDLRQATRWSRPSPFAAFLYNRFHVCPHLQLTPYEAAFGGKPYAGRLCIFGETVYGKMVTPYKGRAQWVAGAWVGINPANDTHSILTDKGAIEAASVRRAATQEPPSKFCGLPWEAASAVLRPKKAKRVGPVAVAFPVADQAPKGRDDDEHGPSSDEEARAVEQAAQALESAKALEEKARDEKAHASDSSEEMIAGEAAPPSRAGSPQRRPEQAAAASAGTKPAPSGPTRRHRERHRPAPRGPTRRHRERHRPAPSGPTRRHRERHRPAPSGPTRRRTLTTATRP